MRELIRNNQDTIFSSLYSDPECVLDLYYTLHPEDRNRGITPEQLKLITLENVFLVQRHNDIAFREEDLQGMQSTLNGYYHFIHFIKNNTVDGKISTEAVENYIRQFKGSKLFKKFLEKLSAEEVIKMLNYEFDLEVAKEVWKEEAMEEGIEQGIRSLMTNLKLNLNQAMDALNIPAEKQPMYAARIQKQ